MGDGKHLYLRMRYRRAEKVKLMYRIFLLRLARLWSPHRKNKALHIRLSTS